MIIPKGSTILLNKACYYQINVKAEFLAVTLVKDFDTFNDGFGYSCPVDKKLRKQFPSIPFVEASIIKITRVKG